MDSFEEIDTATRNILPATVLPPSAKRQATLAYEARRKAPEGRIRTKGESENIAKLCRVHTKKCLAALVEMVETPGPSELKLKAALAILDRGYGRPAQAVEHKVDVDITHLHLEAVRTAAELSPHGVLRITEGVTGQAVDSGIALDRDHVDRADESGTDAGE